VPFSRRETCIVGQGSPQAQLRDARLDLTRNQLFTKQRRKKMAKIINLPTLRKWTEHEQNEFLIQLFEVRKRMNNVVDRMCDQQETEDLRPRLYNEMMAIQSMLTDADELLVRLISKKNNDGL
jgi:hypothetical protein